MIFLRYKNLLFIYEWETSSQSEREWILPCILGWPWALNCPAPAPLKCASHAQCPLLIFWTFWNRVSCCSPAWLQTLVSTCFTHSHYQDYRNVAQHRAFFLFCNWVAHFYFSWILFCLCFLFWDILLCSSFCLWTHYVGIVVLKAVFLPYPSKCRGYRSVPPHQAGFHYIFHSLWHKMLWNPTLDFDNYFVHTFFPMCGISHLIAYPY